MIFKGNCTALVTPFNKSGTKINYEALKKLIDMQLSSNCSAILFIGTTGESTTLSQKEKYELAKFGIEYVNHKVPVIVGAGSNSTKEAIEKSKIYESLGADALLHVTPYYNKCTQTGLLHHYTAIADSVNIPIILYNVPSRTGVNILPETIRILSKHKNIKGIKEASGNMAQIAEILRTCSKDFAVYSGDDSLVVPILSLGGKGVISVTGNISPYLMQTMCDAYFKGNTLYACELQHKLAPLINALFSEVNPIPVKEALNLLGLDVGPCRLPLTKISTKNKHKLKKLLGI